MSVSYCSDVDKLVVLNNFKKRGWKQVSPDDEWNLYWASTKTCHSIFNTSNGFRMKDNQMINHFPNYYELSRKDKLVRNIKLYRRKLEKHRSLNGKNLNLDFIPVTFILPADYNMFVNEYRRVNPSTWIVKPVGKSNGSGIFLINNLSKLTKWIEKIKNIKANNPDNKESYIISKYIDNPLLIGGNKFDLRFYVLVTTFRPLKAYLFKHGFCRFCTIKYNSNVEDIENLLVHLTNVSLQKQGKQYNRSHGGKFSIQNLRLFLEGTRGKAVTDALFNNIVQLIVHSLKSVSNIIMTNDIHSFECYGYDVIVDNNLKPWLIEVNSSPSLETTTDKDSIMKNKLIDNILSVILPPNGIPNARWNKCPSLESLGDFEPIIDEE
jgi:tubulin polyglutamylase TTLL1